jgi:hypothetical protein
VFPFLYDDLKVILVDHPTWVVGTQETDRTPVIFKEGNKVPHAVDRLMSVVPEPCNDIAGPGPSGEWWYREMIVQPVVRALQPGVLLLREVPLVTEEPGLGDDAGQLTMVLTFGADYETDEHRSASYPLTHRQSFRS